MNRRDLLRGGALSLLAAPFLRLLERPARAAELGFANRLLVIHSPNGTIPAHWTPSGTGASYSFPTGSILEPLRGLEPDLLVLTGMDFNTGDNHEGGMRSMLTAGGPTSIDQIVADQIGLGTRFKSLELSALTSAWGGGTQTRMVYRDDAYVTPDDDPLNAWQRLFGDLGDDVKLARRTSVLDLVTEEVATLQSRLGAAERARLDLHLEALRSVERSLAGGGTCDSPIAPAVSAPQDNDNFPDVVKAQLDLAVQALACGATNVCSVQLSHTVSPVVFTWLGQTDSHHGLSHADDGNTAGVDGFVACERWFAEQVRYLLDQLIALPDPATGAPLLDGTVVLWAKEMGDSRAHVCRGVPWVLAGSGNGFFSPGRALDLAGGTHDGVLTSIANAFGVDIEAFGIGTAGPVGVLR
ncbi:MAG: DUF1552 domain-containing protein [Myxococcota bacterium]